MDKFQRPSYRYLQSTLFHYPILMMKYHLLSSLMKRSPRLGIAAMPG